jgi:hypothetical protein
MVRQAKRMAPSFHLAVNLTSLPQNELYSLRRLNLGRPRLPNGVLHDSVESPSNIGARSAQDIATAQRAHCRRRYEIRAAISSSD